MADGYVVRVQPAGVEVVVPAGERLMIAALEQGVRWPNVCGGKAQCGVCLLSLVGGDPPPRTEREWKAILEFRGATAAENPSMRLACQLRPTSDLEVRKVGVRRETELPIQG